MVLSVAGDLASGTVADTRLPTTMAGKTITTSTYNGVTLAGTGTLNVSSGGTLQPVDRSSGVEGKWVADSVDAGVRTIMKEKTLQDYQLDEKTYKKTWERAGGRRDRGRFEINQYSFIPTNILSKISFQPII